MKTRHYGVPLAPGDCKAAASGKQECLFQNTSADRLYSALITVLLLAFVGGTQAATRYVDVNSINATPPYTNWATAATNIQDAVDSAVAGDEIVVTNGVYATGGRDYNRLKVDQPLSVRSVNGPQFTTITGGGTNRCAYLINNASLSGFTLTNGSSSASPGGGVFCESASAVVSNCVLKGNQGYPGVGGGAYGGTLNNCILSSNTVGSSLGIQTGFGGGAAYCTLNNCTLTGNLAQAGVCIFGPCGDSVGGGAYACTLNSCTLSGNSARSGCGAVYCTLNNCTLTGNLALVPSLFGFSIGLGVGAHACTLNNCTLTGNGYGAAECTMNNCTLTGNSNGGAFGCRLTSCIAYFNTGANYDPNCTLDHCCTAPLPPSGVGNISSDPQLASDSHLSALSPCIGKGYYPAVSGTDIDGEPWSNPPSIGCDEYHAGGVTGPLSVAISASFTNVAVGYQVDHTAVIDGRTDLSVWDFGDGALEINQPYTAHSWATPGDYLVSLWAFNDSYPGGISATVTVHVVTGLHYVAANSANAVAPYTSWSTAATDIQSAINAATEQGAQVVVSNGTYAPITAYGHLSVRSVNGPQFTTINGGELSCCARLTTDATLSGFTLTNGVASGGGGAYGGTLNNCALTGNRANGTFPVGAGVGGGALSCTLNNCTLSGNSAGYGGGAANCALNNCTLTGNSGGVVTNCMLNNCIAYFNTGANYDSSCTLNYCCTTPQPTNGFGNITNAPLIVDTNVWANLHLQSNSPCINAGNNAYAPAGLDPDGNPRLKGGRVDIGAYEFQSPISIISYAWLQQYGLPTDGSADFTDPDHDGINNWQEWRCGTNPTNAVSALRMLAPALTDTNVTVTWQSVTGINYFLERGSSLAPPVFTPLATNIPGQQGTTSFTDTNIIGAGPRFYRIGVGGQ